MLVSCDVTAFTGLTTQTTFLGCCFAMMVGVAAAGFAADASTKGTAPKTILVLGDSLAAGYGLDPDKAFPALLQKKLDEQKLPYKVVNAGVSGDTSAGGLRRLSWLLRQRVDVLLLELGGNDGLRGLSPDVTRTNLQSIIDQTRAKYPDVKVVLAGMRMPPNYGAAYVQRFEAIYPALARANQAALIPFLLEGVGGRIDLNLPDRIHPTAEGHKILAENTWAILHPLLRPVPKSGG